MSRAERGERNQEGGKSEQKSTWVRGSEHRAAFWEAGAGA